MEVIPAGPSSDGSTTSHVGLERFRRQFLQMVPMQRLSWPSAEEIKAYDVQVAIHGFMFTQDKPAPSYQFRVLKHLIELIESVIIDHEEDEVSEDLYNAFAQLLPHARRSIGETAPEESIVTFMPPSSLSALRGIELASSEMTNTFSVAGGTGHRTWEASLHLGTFLCTERGRSLTRDKNVLELGAGKGLVSYLCSSYLDVKHMYPTDGDASCVEKLKFYPPGVVGKWSPSQLVWNTQYDDKDTISDLEPEAQRDLDLILGADITFDRTLMPDLARTICHLLRSNRHARAFISATLRNEDTFEAFCDACDGENLLLAEVDETCPAKISEQTGLFHTHEIPIRIVEVIDKSRYSAAEGS